MTPSMPPVPQPGAPPTFADASVALAGQRIRSKSGLGSTILTSGQGDQSRPATALKTLLGQ